MGDPALYSVEVSALAVAVTAITSVIVSGVIVPAQTERTRRRDREADRRKQQLDVYKSLYSVKVDAAKQVAEGSSALVTCALICSDSLKSLIRRLQSYHDGSINGDNVTHILIDVANKSFSGNPYVMARILEATLKYDDYMLLITKRSHETTGILLAHAQQQIRENPGTKQSGKKLIAETCITGDAPPERKAEPVPDPVIKEITQHELDSLLHLMDVYNNALGNFDPLQIRLQSCIGANHWCLGDEVWLDGFHVITEAGSVTDGKTVLFVGDAARMTDGAALWQLHGQLSSTLRSAVHKNELEALTSGQPSKK